MKPSWTIRRLTLAGALILAALLSQVTSVLAQDASVSDAAIPVAFPHDDGPHDAGIEWWYYTGHLFSENGDRYGFEFVVFKGKQGRVTAYASHFAIADHTSP